MSIRNAATYIRIVDFTNRWTATHNVHKNWTRLQRNSLTYWNAQFIRKISNWLLSSDFLPAFFCHFNLPRSCNIVGALLRHILAIIFWHGFNYFERLGYNILLFYVSKRTWQLWRLCQPINHLRRYQYFFSSYLVFEMKFLMTSQKGCFYHCSVLVKGLTETVKTIKERLCRNFHERNFYPRGNFWSKRSF